MESYWSESGELGDNLLQMSVSSHSRFHLRKMSSLTFVDFNPIYGVGTNNNELVELCVKCGPGLQTLTLKQTFF